jgi:hypothetical protein
MATAPVQVKSKASLMAALRQRRRKASTCYQCGAPVKRFKACPACRQIYIFKRDLRLGVIA